MTNEFEDIAIKAWESNPLTDPALIEVRDNVRRSVGIALLENTSRGDGKVIAASWIGTALALVDSLDVEDLVQYVNVLPPAFTRALEAASTAGRIADYHGRDRDWLARNVLPGDADAPPGWPPCSKRSLDVEEFDGGWSFIYVHNLRVFRSNPYATEAQAWDAGMEHMRARVTLKGLGDAG